MRILETASQCSEISQRLKLIENNIARAEKKQEILLVSRLNTSMLEIKDFLSEHLQSIGTRDAATSPTRKKARRYYHPIFVHTVTHYMRILPSSIGKDTILQIHEKHEMYSQKSQYNAGKNLYYCSTENLQGPKYKIQTMNSAATRTFTI